MFEDKVEIGFAVNPETGIGFLQEIEPKPAYIMLFLNQKIY